MPIAQAWEIRVEREAEWDDQQRHRMQALVMYEEACCAKCGWHQSIANDTNNVFAPTDKVCPVCRGYDIVTRVQHDHEDKARESAKANPGAPQPGDGRTTSMRLMSTDEALEYRRKREREEDARGRST